MTDTLRQAPAIVRTSGDPKMDLAHARATARRERQTWHLTERGEFVFGVMTLAGMFFVIFYIILPMLAR